MNDVDDDLLNVRDLGLAAALVCLSYQPVGTRQDEAERVYFMFLKSGAIQTTIDGYWTHTLRVDPRQYSDTLKALKAEIYNQRGLR